MATDIDTLKDAQEKFDYMWADGKKARTAMKKAYGYYIGGKHQWTKDDIAELKEKERAPISSNLVARQIDTLYGIERQNRTGFVATGVGGEDDPVAMLITGLLKYENRNERISQVLARVKKDGDICGVGWVDMGVVKGRDFLNENKVTREHPANVMKDPDGKEYDQSDWHMMGRQKWYSLAKLKSMWPKKLKNINKLKDLLDYSHPEERMTEGTDRSERGGDYGTDDNIVASKYVDEFRKAARAVEIYTREYDKVYFVVSDAKDPKVIEIGTDLDEAELTQAKLNKMLADAEKERGETTGVRFGIRNRMEPRIYHDIFSGKILLEKHVLETSKHRQFPLIPYFAYMEEMGDGTVENYGIVFNLEDLQNEYNKLHSTGMDIFSRAPLLGGIFKKGRRNEEIVKKMSDIGGWHEGNPDDFKEFGGKYLGVLGNVGDLKDRAKDDLETMYINRAMMGLMQSAKESGVLARQRVFQGTLGVQELFEHFDMTKYRVLMMLVENIRQYKTAQWMVKAVGQVPGFEVNDLMQAAATLLAGDGVLDYDVRLDDGESSPSARAYGFAMMMEAMQYSKEGLPLEVIVEASPWPNKKYILEQIKGSREQQMMMAAVQQQAGGGQKA